MHLSIHIRAIAWLVVSSCCAVGQQFPFLPVSGAPKGGKVLFQDSRGRLWVGGDQLACFDGARLFFLRDYGLPLGAINDIGEDASGVIWIATETGVYRFSGGRIEETSKGVAVSVIPSAPDLAVAAIGPLGRGLPANPSLIRIRRDRSGWITETIMNLESAGPLTLDRGGLILYPWPGKGWNEIRLADIPGWRPNVPLEVTRHLGYAPQTGRMRIMRNSSGCVWSSSENDVQYSCGGGKWQQEEIDGAPFRADLHESPEGSMVLAGYNILALGRPGSFQVAHLSNGLPPLESAIQARDGTLWLSSMQGLYRFQSPFRLEYWTAREGVDIPWALQRVGKSMYAGLNRDVAVLNADRDHWRRVASFRKTGQVVNLAADGSRNMIVALNPGTVVLMGHDGKVLARSPHGNDYYGLRLAKTDSGELWLGGIGLGVVKRHGSVLEIRNHQLDTQPAGNVAGLQYEEHTRKLWACYNGGLAERGSDGSWRELTTKDGLLVNQCWSLAATPNGDVWYGYYNTPAFALVRPQAEGRVSVRQFRAGEDIADPETINFDVDRRGWLWRGGNRGVSVADEESALRGEWLFLDQSDGLPGLGVNSGSFFADSDGSIWMGMDVNIMHYTPPTDLVTPQFAQQVFVSAISRDSEAPRLAEAVDQLPHGSKVTVHIGSLQFERRNGLRIRYRVLPGQAQWRETRSLDLPLGDLVPGSHTLEVQGRVFTGPWSQTQRRSFTILKPIWLAWPLLAAYFVTVASLGAGSFFLHRRRKAEDAQVLPDLTSFRLGALLPDVHDLAGTLLDSRFEVRDLLARGGFASVMAGFDHQQKKQCAIKIFRTEVKDKAWIQQSFDNEVSALRRVRHRHVVSIYAQGRTPSGAPYLVMEFIKGRSLREVLEEGPVAPSRAARMLAQLSSALDAIHAEEICHRDVKPENVIVRKEGSPDEEVVLIDFSIAIVKDADETLRGLSRAAGTFDYMAPEQAVGCAQTSSDVYSLAKLLIEMVTGCQLRKLLPVASIDLPARVREIATSWSVYLSEESINMLASALEFDPGRRQSSVITFAQPLIRDLEYGGPESPF